MRRGFWMTFSASFVAQGNWLFKLPSELYTGHANDERVFAFCGGLVA